jgi:xylulose-5-phosphate/fructose-6-phosphate phosphoketolase
MPHLVAGDDPLAMHQRMAGTLDAVLAEITAIQHAARTTGCTQRPRWPMLILRTPKGWTGPKTVDGRPVENSFRAHQVPLGEMDTPEHVTMLEQWMKSYRPEELFDATGKLHPALAALAPQGARRMGANPHANGGIRWRAHAPHPGLHQHCALSYE